MILRSKKSLIHEEAVQEDEVDDDNEEKNEMHDYQNKE
jgi:hypothetical protein